MTRPTDDRLIGLSADRRELLSRVLLSGKRPAGDIPRVPRTGEPLACSHEQRRLWLAQRTDQRLGAPNVTLGLALRGPLDLAALTGALETLVRRHESLRTRYVTIDGEPYQVIDPEPAAGTPPVTPVDLSAETDPEAAAARLAVAACGERFDLATGPLLRLTVYRLAPGEHRLLLVCHHIACDGGSLGTVARDLADRYSELARGTAGPADAPPAPGDAPQYADYAAWSRRRVRARLPERLAYWREHLGAEEPLFGAGTPAAPLAPGERISGTVHAEAAGEAVARLRAAAGGNATPYTVLLTALSMLLARFTGRSAVTVGMVSARRERRELERMVGCFINLVPLRIQVPATAGFAELARRAREAIAAGLAHEIPFDTLVSALGGRRQAGVHPLFQVALIQRDDPAPPAPWADLAVSVWEHEVDETACDLTVTMTPAAGGYRLAFTYRRDRTDEAAMRSLAPACAALLETLAAAPGTPLADLALPELVLPGRGAEQPHAGTPPRAAAVPGPAPAAGDLTEEQLDQVRRIWSEVLGTGPLDDDADLFDLGADSLAITKIAARVHETLGIEVPPWAFFEAPTIAGFAAALRASG